MGRTRRQPPLYEVLSSPSRRLGGSTAAPRPGTQPPPAADAPVPELKPVPAAAPEPEAAAPAAHPAPTIRVHAPATDYSRVPAPLSSPSASSPSATSPAAHAEEDGPVRISSTTMMIGLGLLIIVFAVVWAVAFQMGQKKRDNDLGRWMPTDTVQPDAGAGSAPIQPPAPSPARPDGSGNAARKPEPVKPAPTPTPAAGADPRVPGLNYLYLGTLTLKDATAGVEFLKRNGVQAFHVVDRSRGGVNNPPCRIYASQGFAGGASFRETQKERDELVRRVEELGKKWQREEKGPSDFRQPYWTLHKE